MKKRIIVQVLYLFPLFILSACTKDDNEPMPQSTVSRLYVSNADTDAAVANTMIFDPADQTAFKVPYKFDSKLPDANGILFNAISTGFPSKVFRPLIVLEGLTALPPAANCASASLII